MKDEIQDLIEFVKKARPEDWAKITRHRNALTEILIEFSFDGMMGRDQHRVYEVRRSYSGAYNSAVSGGQEHWTHEPSGPNGEPITMYREWLVSERGGYIGSFRNLDELALMILHQLRGRDVFVVSDSTLT